MWDIPVHMARNAEGLNRQVGIGGQKALERKIPNFLIPAQDGRLTQALEASIGWPGAPIPLLTACIPDAILVSTASWPGNLIRGVKLRQQEVQPCPGLR